MRSIFYRPSAIEDLSHIFDFIAKDSPQRAINIKNNIHKQCRDQLLTFPYVGVERGDIHPNIRILHLPKQRVSVAYEVQNDAIIIRRIFYAGADYEANMKH